VTRAAISSAFMFVNLFLKGALHEMNSRSSLSSFWAIEEIVGNKNLSALKATVFT
jgi:hypothetical protein